MSNNPPSPPGRTSGYKRFFAELKRRKVFQVAAVYGATAFVVLQVVDLLQEGLNLPRYPTLKGRLGAKKKEVTVMEAGGEPGGQAMLTLLAPPSQDTPTEILGDGAAAAPAVVDVLERIGVL